VGENVSTCVGEGDGVKVGEEVGEDEGCKLGAAIGVGVGADDGDGEGALIEAAKSRISATWAYCLFFF
jgi:hypothetical protein